MDIIDRQNAIELGEAEALDLPKFDTYAICNLRGGIGKTTLSFNLAYYADRIIVADTCPQCNLTWFFDHDYLSHVSVSVYDMLLPHFVPGLGFATRVSRSISATNQYFEGKNAFFLPSDNQLYILPSQITTAIVQAERMTGSQQTRILDSMLFSLRDELRRELSETKTERCLIDTSPFFSGATHLAWHACDALIVPVRTDQQSINSLTLLLRMLSDPSSEFRKICPSNGHTPKIQMIVLTHCGWSTVKNARNVPNKQTKIYIEKTLDIIRQNIVHFTTDNPDNHILLLDDFLGTGRISSAKSKPIALLNVGEGMTINRVRTEVNSSVEKVKRQLKYISDSIW
ncbi:MAG: ParA family protein [Desulfovibrionaceae bacterium]|nr:ParA family protein [Desulfovibrionaceae bacterium]